MSELDNVTKLKHINSLADQTARAINELLINGLSGVGGTADVFTGATSLAGGASGLVPAPAAGDNEKFLRGDGTWAVPTFTIGTTSSTLEGAMWLED